MFRDLYLLFRKYGTILSVHTMINKTTGLSKGYGFVSYSSREEAKAAISAMDGFRVRITINLTFQHFLPYYTRVLSESAGQEASQSAS